VGSILVRLKSLCRGGIKDQKFVIPSESILSEADDEQNQNKQVCEIYAAVLLLFVAIAPSATAKHKPETHG
jgi:hypothetical protein